MDKFNYYNEDGVLAVSIAGLAFESDNAIRCFAFGNKERGTIFSFVEEGLYLLRYGFSKSGNPYFDVEYSGLGKDFIVPGVYDVGGRGEITFSTHEFFSFPNTIDMYFGDEGDFTRFGPADSRNRVALDGMLFA